MEGQLLVAEVVDRLHLPREAVDSHWEAEIVVVAEHYFLLKLRCLCFQHWQSRLVIRGP